MDTNAYTVNELAAVTRSTRVMVKLPGISQALTQKGVQIYAELIEWDRAENILEALKGE